MSIFKRGIKATKFDPCIGGVKAPINPSLLMITLLFPDGYLSLQDGKLWNAPV
jgi:hypothetical protein